MDINDLFDGMAEAFRRYQQEMTHGEGTLTDQLPVGLEPKKEPEKTEKKLPTEKTVKQNFPKRE